MSKGSYKLIKKYPGCHHTLGTIIPKGGQGWMGLYGDLEEGLHSEFWELIKEKEWEILGKTTKWETKTEGYFSMSISKDEIKSIKRLSDNEVFSIGDKCNLSNGNGNRNPILRFEVRNENFGLEKYRNKDRVVIFLETMHKTEWGPIELDSLVKSKEPLFITEDGVEVFIGDSYWFLDDDKPTEVIHAHNQSGKNNLKCFSTQKAAKDYIHLNKPKYSLQDIFNAKAEGSKFPTHFAIDFDKLKK